VENLIHVRMRSGPFVIGPTADLTQPEEGLPNHCCMARQVIYRSRERYVAQPVRCEVESYFSAISPDGAAPGPRSATAAWQPRRSFRSRSSPHPREESPDALCCRVLREAAVSSTFPVTCSTPSAAALARLLQVHAHDNPLGAVRDRWPASVYVDGTQWEWLLRAARTLESHLSCH
jgi:hypothetical protein